MLWQIFAFFAGLIVTYVVLIGLIVWLVVTTRKYPFAIGVSTFIGNLCGLWVASKICQTHGHSLSLAIPVIYAVFVFLARWYKWPDPLANLAYNGGSYAGLILGTIIFVF